MNWGATVDKILLVDDEIELANMIKDYLKNVLQKKFPILILMVLIQL